MKIRRIVVALEAAPRGLAALEAAVALAGRLDAELVGLFVEDVDLLHFAALPFAHEIGHASAARRKLDVAAMEQYFRALADETQRALESSARRSAVRWSFRVARGSPPAELLAAASDTDLVIAFASAAEAFPSEAAAAALEALTEALGAEALAELLKEVRSPVYILRAPAARSDQ